MRVIEQKLHKAIVNKDFFKLQNTEVIQKPNGFDVRLHGNLIFNYRAYPDRIEIRASNCGWATNTTTSRLKTIFSAIGLNVSVRNRGGSTEFHSEEGVQHDTFQTVR